MSENESHSPRQIDRRKFVAGAVGLGAGSVLGNPEIKSAAAASTETEDLENTPLKEIATSRGITVSSLIDILSTPSTQMVRSNFNGITDASYVWGYDINEDPNEEYSFFYPRQTAAFAKQGSKELTGMHLAWGYPNRLPEHIRNSSFGPGELVLRLEDHVTKLVEQGKGKVNHWSAINEPFDDNGNYKPEDLFVQNSSVWTNGLYPDYIPRVLLRAHQVDPEATLLINDFDTHSFTNRFGAYNLRADANYNLMAQLLEDPLLTSSGFNFDKLAWGTQFHVMDASMYPDEAAVAQMAAETESNLARFKNDLGRDVYVTEFDVKIHNLPGEQEAKLAHQALIYRYGTRAALAAGVTYFGFWGASDQVHPDTWTEPTPESGSGGKNSDPTLFDDQNKPKPALQAVKEEISILPTIGK